MLPGMNGLELLAQLRREALPCELSRKDVYVILLTAKNEETDKLVGLAVGADDYLIKPFSPRELVARIKVALRRLQNDNNLPDSQVREFDHLRLDTAAAHDVPGRRR